MFRSKNIVTALIISLFTCQANATLPQAEKDALLALYNATDGANWTTSTNWTVGDPCDNSWYGVTCQPDGTSIFKLELRGNNLTGPIPKELGSITQLIVLDLIFNQLNGSIPPELGELSNLAFLYLTANQLSGPAPPELGNLSNLGGLHLDANQLDGSIPPELGLLSNLGELTFDSNELTGSIPVELGNLANLTFLNLAGNRLTGPIPTELANIPNLDWLVLAHNQLDGAIPPELANIGSLRVLGLNKNRLTGVIPKELGNLSNLFWLDLADNHLIGTIPPELGNLTNLEHFFLQGNQLSGNIPAELMGLAQVGTGRMDIRWNLLHTSEATLDSFLDSKSDHDWSATQTISPRNLEVTGVSGNSVSLSWQPIEYQQDAGRYSVSYAQSVGGTFVDGGSTPDKTQSVLTVENLMPGSAYFFMVQSETNSHVNNANMLVSNNSKLINTVSSFFNQSTSFDSNLDFLSDPMDGSIFNQLHVNSGFAPLQDATVLALDSNMTNSGTLTLTSQNSTWQDGEDDGVFLSSTMFSDFIAVMAVLDMDVLPGHAVGLMVRIQPGENLDAGGPGQDWVTIAVSGDLGSVVTQNTDDGLSVETAETPLPANMFTNASLVSDEQVELRVQRNSNVIRLSYRFGGGGSWTEAEPSPLLRNDMVGQSLEVGIFQTSVDTSTALVTHFSLSDERIFSSGFD